MVSDMMHLVDLQFSVQRSLMAGRKNEEYQTEVHTVEIVTFGISLQLHVM